MSEPTPFPLPDGPLSRYLLDPAGHNQRTFDAVVGWLQDALGVMALVLLGIVLVGLLIKVVTAARDRRLAANGRRILILPPAEVDPKAAKSFWMGLHGLLRPWWARLLIGQPYVSWESSGRPEEIGFSVWVPGKVPPGLIEKAIETAWPGSRTIVAEGDRPFASEGHVAVSELSLSEPDWFPIGEGADLDALRLALASLTGLEQGEEALIQILARPVPSSARRRLMGAARAIRAGVTPGRWKWRAARSKGGLRLPPDPTAELDVRAILQKAASPLFEVVVRVAVASPDKRMARGRIHSLAGGFAAFEGRNGFRRRRSPGAARRLRSRLMSKPYLLSAPEVAQIAALQATGSLPGLEAAGTRPVSPAKAIPSEGKTLGNADASSVDRKVAIAVEDARQHVHLIGATGTGKSTLLAQLVLEDAAEGRSAVVIDPKGDLIETILERLPAEAEERTCLLDPTDPEWAVGLNLLDGLDDDLVVENLVDIFRRVFEPWWGPRTDYIMRTCCLILKRIPGATVAEIPLLLTNSEWQKRLSSDLADVAWLKQFWDWYTNLTEKSRNEQISGLLNKLAAVLMRGPARMIVGQPKPKLNIEGLIDHGGLILVRVPKGMLGEETSRLLGSFVIARVWQACMKRVDRPEEERPDTTLYVDEMHNYLTLPRSFEDLLAEARGYHLSMVLAHQHLGQLPRDMREAIGANARTKIVFGVSPEDAHNLEKHFLPELSAHDLSNLSAFHAACRPGVKGAQGRPFTFKTIPLPSGEAKRAAGVRKASAKLFATSRTEVEKAIANRQANAVKQLIAVKSKQIPHPAPSGDPSAKPYGAPPSSSPPDDGKSSPEAA